MKYTDNYNLKKPDGTDVVNIEDFNSNADIIDTELNKKANTTTVNNKVDKVTGKGLSTNDYSDTEKQKVADSKTNLESHLAESTQQAHLAKNIGLEDTEGNFVATEVEGAMSELFTNVSSGKDLVGRAITDVDDSVVIPTNPTFQDLADGIRKISTGFTIEAGDVWFLNIDERVSNNETTYKKVREVEVFVTGSIRVFFNLASTLGGWVSGRIYINGEPVGTERSVYEHMTGFTEDFDVQNGDLIQVFIKKDASSTFGALHDELKLGIASELAVIR